MPPEPEKEVARLIAEARDVEVTPESRLRPPAENLTGRLLDIVGRIALPVGLVATLVGFGLSSIGPEWAGASLLYLVTLVLFILYIPALFRANARRRYNENQTAREQQIQARAEIARIVLEQSEQSQPSNEPLA